MRVPPSIAEFTRFPVVAGTALLAIGVTIARQMEVPGVRALVCDAHVAFGEPWRLITSALPHVDFIHLIFNVYWLWVLGSFVEETFGHFFTLGLIVLFAAGSAGAEYAVLKGGVGLSGVGYGLFGMLWALSRHDRQYREIIDRNTITLFVAWFFICIIATYAEIMPVANIAHGVGGLLGWLVGWAIARKPLRVVAGGGAVLLTAMFCVAAIWFRPTFNFSKHRGEDEARLGYQAIEAQDYRLAEGLLRQSVRLNPKLAGSWHNLGYVLRALGREKESDDAYAESQALRAPSASGSR